ncbi:cytochrome P450 [Streptomyces griseochromogenes]|uniref:Cytochrome P450 n=2 Tax=Streptomyces griseochromogenes TaxID=68214 RepID=A0ABS4M7Z5_9ACTN|nr:cytochrome P450 [Streptomyces griseochromogenes]MBP2055800.1 cytochrome P450 [Streptomyces griseochromogenes]
MQLSEPSDEIGNETETEMVGDSFARHPHDVYRRWREEGGVRKVRFAGAAPLAGWVVTGHAACRAALADPRLSKDGATEAYARHEGLPVGGPGGGLTSHMLNSDPPRHTRLRRLVQQAFTQRRVADLRPRIEAHVTTLLDALDGTDEGDEVDLIARFALPLPLAVIFDLLGADPAAHGILQVRGHTVSGDGGDGEVSVPTAEAMLERLRALIAEKRARPGDDLLSALLTAGDGGDRLTGQEVTSMAFLLVIAGHQTTVNLVANGLLALLAHPAQLAAVRADPSLIPSLTDEVLRHESPFALASLRYTTEPVTIDGTTIPAGEFVQIALAAANRDPEVFADPDRFDVTRDASQHLAFGHGVHHCLGAPLARLQAEIAFAHVLRRFPGLRLAHPERTAEWQDNPRHRGLLTLPVRLR